jgi:hypothetical protein
MTDSADRKTPGRRRRNVPLKEAATRRRKPLAFISLIGLILVVSGLLALGPYAAGVRTQADGEPGVLVVESVKKDNLDGTSRGLFVRTTTLREEDLK